MRAGELIDILESYGRDAKLLMKVGDADSDGTDAEWLYINYIDEDDGKAILELEMRLPPEFFIGG